jgi:hypothetical protein
LEVVAVLFLLVCTGACVVGGAALFAVMYRGDRPFLGMVGLGVLLVAGVFAATYAGVTSD